MLILTGHPTAGIQNPDTGIIAVEQTDRLPLKLTFEVQSSPHGIPETTTLVEAVRIWLQNAPAR